MTSPAYAIIIPHYQDEARLTRCLRAILQSDISDCEVCVVDNGSPNAPTVPPDVRLIIEPQKGAANARNAGVAQTTAPYLLFIDSDCVPDSAWLDRAKTVARKNAITGGRIEVFDETPSPRTGAQAFETVFAFDNARYIREENFSVTANLVTSREVFEAVGPMISGVSEDMEWCQRAVRQGYAITYDHALLVSHPTRSDWASLSRKWKRLTTEMYHVKPDTKATWIKALLMPFSIVAHIPRVLSCDRLDALEKRRAIGTLARLRLSRAVWMIRLATGRQP